MMPEFCSGSLYKVSVHKRTRGCGQRAICIIGVDSVCIVGGAEALYEDALCMPVSRLLPMSSTLATMPRSSVVLAAVEALPLLLLLAMLNEGFPRTATATISSALVSIWALRVLSAAPLPATSEMESAGVADLVIIL